MIPHNSNMFYRALHMLRSAWERAHGTHAIDSQRMTSGRGPDNQELKPIFVLSTRIWGTRMVFQAETLEKISKI